MAAIARYHRKSEPKPGHETFDRLDEKSRAVVERLAALGLSPVDVADAVQRLFVDVAAGSVRLGEQSWLLRVVGKRATVARLHNSHWS